jgi:hypothetical protein
MFDAAWRTKDQKLPQSAADILRAHESLTGSKHLPGDTLGNYLSQGVPDKLQTLVSPGQIDKAVRQHVGTMQGLGMPDADQLSPAAVLRHALSVKDQSALSPDMKSVRAALEQRFAQGVPGSELRGLAGRGITAPATLALTKDEVGAGVTELKKLYGPTIGGRLGQIGSGNVAPRTRAGAFFGNRLVAYPLAAGAGMLAGSQHPYFDNAGHNRAMVDALTAQQSSTRDEFNRRLQEMLKNKAVTDNLSRSQRDALEAYREKTAP